MPIAIIIIALEMNVLHNSIFMTRFFLWGSNGIWVTLYDVSLIVNLIVPNRFPNTFLDSII